MTLFEKEFRGVVDEGGTNCIAGTSWILDLLTDGAAECGEGEKDICDVGVCCSLDALIDDACRERDCKGSTSPASGATATVFRDLFEAK